MGAYTVKKRTLPFVETSGVHSTTTSTSSTSYVLDCKIQGKQETVSRDNPGYTALRELRKRARDGTLNPHYAKLVERGRDRGGNFETIKHVYSDSHQRIQIGPFDYLGTIREYSGPMFARTADVSPGSVFWPSPPADLSSIMIGKGTTAISRCIPTNPVSGVAVMLGELKEGIPKLPGAQTVRQGRRSLPKRASDEYLNLEFGLKPLVNDLQDVGRAIKTSNKVLDQLRRDSGRQVRRRYEFPVEETTEVREAPKSGSYPAPALPTMYYGSSGVRTCIRTTRTKYVFSGAFTYLYQDGESQLEKLRAAEQRANKLFGTRITPELLWELTPWSWAVDWVTNFGDVARNVSAFANDGLVMTYGYIQCHTVITDTYTLSGSLTRSGGGVLSQSFTTEVKKRLKATPYGFGLDSAAFTPRQWAIIAALGISRGRD